MCEDFIELEAPSQYSSVYIPLSKKRIIFLNEEVTHDTGTQLTSLLYYYDNVSNEPITIYINSPGGSADALINIYDVMSMVKAPIKTICLGFAASAAAVILAAGDMRLAFKHSKVMIHGLQSSIPYGNQLETADHIKYLEVLNSKVISLLAKHVGKEESVVNNDCKEDCYLTPEDALAYGLIDAVIPNAYAPEIFASLI